MRPLYHPAPGDFAVESILYALADPVRLCIYAAIAGSSGPQNCSSFLTISKNNIPKSTLSQHFKILREAGLIRGERHGVEMLITSRGAEVGRRFPGLISAILKASAAQAKVKINSSRAPKRKARR